MEGGVKGGIGGEGGRARVGAGVGDGGGGGRGWRKYESPQEGLLKASRE